MIIELKLYTNYKLLHEHNMIFCHKFTDKWIIFFSIFFPLSAFLGSVCIAALHDKCVSVLSCAGQKYNKKIIIRKNIIIIIPVVVRIIVSKRKKFVREKLDVTHC